MLAALVTAGCVRVAVGRTRVLHEAEATASMADVLGVALLCLVPLALVALALWGLHGVPERRPLYGLLLVLTVAAAVLGGVG